MSVKSHTHGLRTCTPQRTIRLQKNSTSTNGVQSPSPQQIRLPRHMGISLRQRMVPGSVTRTLPNTRMPYQVHPKQATIQHSALQAQKHHKPVPVACRQNHESHIRPCQRPKTQTIGHGTTRTGNLRPDTTSGSHINAGYTFKDV